MREITCIQTSKQIPVEIWHKILSIAISYPLLPREDDGYFEYQQIILFNCETIAMYKASERVRSKLRLVCRSWDHFLDQHSDRLVNLNTMVPNGYWPPVKRWDRVVRIEGADGIICNCGIPPCWPYKEPLTQWLPDVPPSGDLVNMSDELRKKFLPLIGNHCRAILRSFIWRDQLVDPDGVIFLSGINDSGRYDLSSTEISQKYPKLTHLEITTSALYEPSHHFLLPRLRLLSISVSNHEDEPPFPSIQTGYWHLPLLRCLILSIPRLLNREVRLDLSPLIDSIGGSVKEFFVRETNLHLEFQQITFSKEIWRSMPDLQLLGAGIELLSSMKMPVVGHSLDFCFEFHELFSTSAIPLHIDKSSLEFLQGICERVFIDKPWREILKWFASEAPWMLNGIHSSVELLDQLDALGVGLYDCRSIRYDEDIRFRVCATGKWCPSSVVIV
ncbi:hypothetical protein M408DRAFT_231550 [Serendipita vermifera MAFF 305830]|uniref:Uncharacterized protein n=1 Tax=Serendipita vermifera MAFF 305830 TaxID=933852 RepID=A0A0C3AXA3_SERVB|nr:hypothetical protein M408DRAFT_231550 [Serendipita vermifera MAFF 305830]